MSQDAKVQIGLSSDFLEGVGVTTPAGANLFREGVVISDPELPGARAEVRTLGAELTTNDYGLITHSVIQGFSTGGGGGYHDVKVTPSGALTVEANIVEPVALDAATLAALENVNATVSGTVEITNDVGNPIPVSGSVSATVTATDLDIRNLSSVQDNVRAFDSTDSEYLRVATSVTAIGDTTLVTPSAGKRIRLQWVYAINDPVASTSTKITVKLGTAVQYVAWAISKRQQLTGAVDAPLVINLSNVGDVAVTVFYQEV
jgi:hypothetical protein